MAEPSELIRHVESYIDSSGSSTQQAASVEAIASLFKNDRLTLETLVMEMGLYLTSTDNIIRARGIVLLAEVLTCLSSNPLEKATIDSLIRFFTERLADWKALRGALVGCLALMRRKGHVGRVTTTDAKAVLEAYRLNLHVQSLGQQDRKLCFELLECLLENYPDAVIPLGNNIVDAICEAMDSEKDPQCLILTFHIVEVLARLFPDSNGPLANVAVDLFDILGCYFPIHFTHVKSEDLEIKRDDLSRALMQAFSSTAFFEPFAVPLLLEKLSSDLPSAKVDSLKYLGCCILRYGADRMAKHAESIWPLLKHAIFSAPPESVIPFSSVSLDGPGYSKNEIVDEALTVLQKVVMQNSDLYFNLILRDEDLTLVMDKISSFKSYAEISLERKQELHSVGCVLAVFTKTCIASCNQTFERYFPGLLEALGLCGSSRNYSRVGEYSVNENSNFGALFLSVVLLEASRDLIVESKLPSQPVSVSDACWCMLQSCSASLAKAFTSILRRNSCQEIPHSDIYLGVKGLQVLATFPGDFLPIDKSLFEAILTTLVSIITENFKSAFVWNLALKALVKVGVYIQKYHQSEKAPSFMVIVVEKIGLLLISAESSMPYTLKLEALSGVGMSGMNYMRRFVRAIEDSLFSNMSDLYVHGNTKSAEKTVQLLECYSKKILPWMHESGGPEEVFLQFVVNFLNQIKDCKDFISSVEEKEVVDASMRALKGAVVICSESSQNVIIEKAQSMLLSSSIFSSILDAGPVEMERRLVTLDLESISARDRWILSLYASVVIALRPSIHLPNVNLIVPLFLKTLLMGHVPAAQALGSIINKLHSKPNGEMASSDYSLEFAIDSIFCTSLNPENGLNGVTDMNLQMKAIVGFAWIGKGLVMRGHGKVKDITMAFLKFLLPNDERPPTQSMLSSVMKCAADAFRILISDSEDSLNRSFHATIRPLYKQRFFSTMMPILRSLIVKCDSSFTRPLLYRALTHIICEAPLVAVIGEARQIISLLVDALLIFNNDDSDKDLMYSLLLVLSGILMDRKGQEIVIENAHIIISCLTRIVIYPHMMLVRETALQCLVAMSTLPHTRIYPMKAQVLKSVSRSLDDPKRAIRLEAVRCRHAWLGC